MAVVLGINHYRLWGLLGVLAGCPLPHMNNDSGDSESGTSGASTGASEIPAVCARWAGCTAEIDPKTAAEMAAQYGDGGSCWQQDDAEQAGCIAFCDGRLREYGDAFPEIEACRYADIVGTVEYAIGEAVFNPEDPLEEPVYRELEPGGTLRIVRGGQGLLMLPLAVRGRGFETPADPDDWDNPKMPRIELWVDVEGFNVGLDGYFGRVKNYPIGFVPIDGEGTLEHLYIAVLVPDGIDDPEQLTGKPGRIRAALRTYKQPTTAREYSFVVAPEIQQ